LYNLKNNFDKGARSWETEAAKKTSKKAENKVLTNGNRRQRISLKNNKRGDQNWYCRNKNRDSIQMDPIEFY
jgi:hypothetical protein